MLDLNVVAHALYYGFGIVAFIAAFIRVAYGWFRDYDNANRFTYDMARSHLPAIYQALSQIADRVGVELAHPPNITLGEK